ncbi:MAG: histidine phosphatase family protein [Alphaproteobacteria bacterium]|nr:histidine phosphatase family protein [Alphaproteobacteria bacterium]
MTQIPLKTFYMMRHGESQSNAEGYAAGSFDTPLTEKGRHQALDARRIFETLTPRPALIAHSHLSRAKDTAQILNQKTNLPEIETPLIAEQCYGDWMGQPWEDLRDRLMSGEKPPNGESMDMLTSRAIKGLSEILSLPDRPPLIVTHGGVFKALLRLYQCKMDSVKNCSIYSFTPAASKQPFPWDVCIHDLSGSTPIKVQAL